MGSFRAKAKDLTIDIAGYILLSFALIIAFMPLVWMILNSFRSSEEIFMKPMSLPEQFNLMVFATAWRRARLNTAFVNSILNMVGTNALVLIAATSAAFAIARIKFVGAKVISGLLASSIVISGQLVLLPLFIVLRKLHVYNTLWATIIADAALYLPICITLFTGFFKEIPYELEESTVMDGCSKWRFFYRFMIPLSKPILATALIFVSLWTWNEYLFALTFLKDNLVRTIPVQLQNFSSQYSVDYGPLFAALSIAIVPLLILYITMQSWFIKGLTAGAIK